MTTTDYGDPHALRVRTRDRLRWGRVPNGLDRVLWNDGTASRLEDVLEELEEVTEPCSIPGCALLGDFHGMCASHWIESPYQARAPFWAGNYDEGTARARAYYQEGDGMKLSQSKESGKCNAMRCTSESRFTIDGAPWGRARAELCERHYGQAIAAFGADAIKVIEIDAARADDPLIRVPPDVRAALPARNVVRSIMLEPSDALVVPSVDLEPEKVEAKDLLDAARTFVIREREDLEVAAEVLADVKGRLARVTERKEEITKPLNAALKSARALFRPLEDFYSEAETLLKGAIGRWHLQEEEANRAAQRAAAEAHAKGDAQARADALAKVGTIRATEGISAYTKWDYEIVDESALPREFLMPNEKLIREACNHSTDRQPTPIPGVRFFPKPVVSSRSS